MDKKTLDWYMRNVWVGSSVEQKLLISPYTFKALQKMFEPKKPKYILEKCNVKEVEDKLNSTIYFTGWENEG